MTPLQFFDPGFSFEEFSAKLPLIWIFDEEARAPFIIDPFNGATLAEFERWRVNDQKQTAFLGKDEVVRALWIKTHAIVKAVTTFAFDIKAQWKISVSDGMRLHLKCFR